MARDKTPHGRSPHVLLELAALWGHRWLCLDPVAPLGRAWSPGGDTRGSMGHAAGTPGLCPAARVPYVMGKGLRFGEVFVFFFPLDAGKNTLLKAFASNAGLRTTPSPEREAKPLAALFWWLFLDSDSAQSHLSSPASPAISSDGAACTAGWRSSCPAACHFPLYL